MKIVLLDIVIPFLQLVRTFEALFVDQRRIKMIWNRANITYSYAWRRQGRHFFARPSLQAEKRWNRALPIGLTFGYI
jgi:hypothetical protein